MALTAQQSTLYGTGNKNISDSDIQAFLKNATSEKDILNAALTYGVSAQQISNAMGGQGGYDMGNIQKYLDSQGIAPPPEPAKATTKPAPIIYPASGSTKTGLLNTTTTGTSTGGTNTAAPVTTVAPPQAVVAPTVEKLPDLQWNNAQTVTARQDQKKGTVSGQLDAILNNPNSPLMQRAQTIGAQYANRRGLLNSSIGGSAAQTAMIDSALQIANPDAASSNQFALTNANAANQMNLANSQGQFNASMGSADNALKVGLTNAANQMQASTFNSDAALKAGMFSADAMNRSGMFDQEMLFKNRTFDAGIESETLWRTMDNDTKLRAIDLGAQHDQTLQSNNAARALYTGGLQMMAEIQSSDRPNKQAELDNVTSYIQNGLALFGAMSNPSVANDLDFSKYMPQASQKNKQAQFVSASSGKPLGEDPANPNIVNTVGGFMPKSTAKVLAEKLEINPEFAITQKQTWTNDELKARVTEGIKNGTIFKVNLTQFAGVKQGGMFGGSKEVNAPIDPRLADLGQFIYYDPNNSLGLAANAQATV